jgi:type IV secretory pathway TraG/TraD family ATPase VirD4
MPLQPQHEIAGGTWLGFHDWYMRAKLRLKTCLVIGASMGLLHVLVAAGVYWFWHAEDLSLFKQYLTSEFTAHRLPEWRVIASFLSTTWHQYQLAWQWTSPVWALLIGFWLWWAKRARALRARKYLRGSRLEEQAQLPLRSSLADGMALGHVWLRRADEIRHFLCIGRPGVGKTVLFQAVLDQLLERDEHAKILIYDFKGDYMTTFARAGDALFNPMDQRSVSWNIFSDLSEVMDIDAVCQSLVPESRNEDQFWMDSARAVLTGILHLCWHHNTRTNAAIWHWLTRPTKELAEALASIPQGHRGWKAIEDASSKQALGVMATLMLYAKGFEFMAHWSGGWSVREWVSAPGRGVLFVSNTPRVKDTLKPVLSLCIDLLGRTLLSMPDDLQRRVYFVIDEFGTLQRLSTITDLLTLSRSKGGSVWLGIQDLGQIDRLYHRDVRQTIVNACGNTAVFALADPETQAYVSRLIGEVEYEDPDLHHSIADAAQGSFGIRRQVKTAPLIMPSELQSLPDLTCLIRTSRSSGVWARTMLAYRPRPTRTDAFKPLPHLVLPQTGLSSMT